RDAEPPPDSGSIYRALWAFQSQQGEHLSFREGDLFRVLSRRDDWWSVRRIDASGRVLDSGLVPGNYLAPAESGQTQPWFFGTLNRLQAQSHLLAPENSEGAFLIRVSEKDNVGYVLSVRSGDQVKHYKVLQTDQNRFYVEPGRRFSSLAELVDYYQKTSLNNAGPLGNPCKRRELFDMEPWERPREEFRLLRKLGEGHFGEVWEALWSTENRRVAIKTLKQDSELNHGDFQTEVQILKNLRHRHLLSLFAVCTESRPYWIITELMEKGSLLIFLRSPEGQNQDVASLIDMGTQVADGMSYLEEQKSIHRDLAARNVLVGEDYTCKVGDFGLARVIKEPFYITEDKKIPYKWTAPEAISHGKFSNKSDVWSFGILLYEITTYGGVPYPAMSVQEAYQQVTAGYRMPAPAKCPHFLYQIMLKCWAAEPDDRPDFRTLKVELDN
uniref:Tyrosine-protein kinase n=1 Tax=Tetraodon nigroviridis TaxID=99883 RepID=H3C956_TETNG